MGVKGSWSRVACHKDYRANHDAIWARKKKTRNELAKRQKQADQVKGARR